MDIELFFFFEWSGWNMFQVNERKIIKRRTWDIGKEYYTLLCVYGYKKALIGVKPSPTIRRNKKY